MASLEEDLKTYADELFTKNDLEAGLKIASELAGFVGTGGLGVAVCSTLVPILGIPVTITLARKLTFELAKRYVTMPTEERKQVRAVVRWIKGGFSLADRLIDG
ncbi:hypothetical protein ACKFKF_06805 [Phormidesmis sp. 146-12]